MAILSGIAVQPLGKIHQIRLAPLIILTGQLSDVRMSGGDSSHLLRMLAAQYEPPTQGQRSNKQCDREKSCTWYHREGMVHAECANPKKDSKDNLV